MVWKISRAGRACDVDDDMRGHVDIDDVNVVRGRLYRG